MSPTKKTTKKTTAKRGRPPSPIPTIKVAVRVPQPDRDRWLAAAREVGLDLQGWIKLTCTAAVKTEEAAP